MKFPIYVDHHATTPVDPQVLDAMLPYLREKFGNASSSNHSFGWEAKAAVEHARRQVAQLINARAEEIVFTSGATESDNLAIKGAAWKLRAHGDHIVTLPTEHKAVIDSCHRLEREGFRVTWLQVERDGRVDLDRLKAALTDRTILVSIMAANNETGVVQPMADIGRLCHERGILFHSDAVQAVGKVPIDIEAMHIDLMSITAHKMYGPKGAGALYVRSRRRRVEIEPLIDGGGHEHGMRSGTLNVPGIVGLGKACEICRKLMPEESLRLAAWRDRLKNALVAQLPGLHINGSMEHRLPHSLNVSFRGVEIDSLLMALEGIAVSSGSACQSAQREQSYVLKALGLEEELALNPLRFGLGRFNTEEEVDYVIAQVVQAVKSIREVSASAEAGAR